MSRKNISIAFLCSLIMAFLITPQMTVYAEYTSSITIGNADADSGGYVEIPVTLSNNPGVSSMILDIDYDKTKLDLASVDFNRSAGGFFAYKSRAVWGNTANNAFNGELFTLGFNVLDNVEGEACINVSFKNGNICNNAESNVPFTVTNGKITVKKALPDYFVRYDANGGTDAPESQGKKQGVGLYLTQTEPKRMGHKFIGWNTKADGSGTYYATGAFYSKDADLLLYAQWQPETYKVSYIASGGEPELSEQTKYYGRALTLNAAIPTKTGYIFTDWNTKEDGSGTTYAAGASYSGNANLFLYAQWQLETYTISYNATGGSPEPSEQTKYYGNALALSSTVPSKPGYDFTGWNTDINGTGTGYKAGASYTANVGVTLYAQWAKKSFTVSYDANGGSMSVKSQKKYFGENLTLTDAIPQKSGYSFVDWNTKKDGSGLSFVPGDVYVEDADAIFYAQWKANGSAVCGAVTSFGDASGKTTIRLLSGNAEIAKTSTSSGTYSISNVPAGSYILEVSKTNHVTRQYSITVGSSAVTQDVKICLFGDVTGDGKVTTIDAVRANSHAKGATLLTGYELKCADVIGTDGKVTTVDFTRINSHARGVNLLW